MNVMVRNLLNNSLWLCLVNLKLSLVNFMTYCTITLSEPRNLQIEWSNYLWSFQGNDYRKQDIAVTLKSSCRFWERILTIVKPLLVSSIY